MEDSTKTQDASNKSSTESVRAPAITILHFNDIYNVLEQEKEPKGGAARFKTAMKSFADRDPLVIFCGDALSPSVMSTFTKGEQMVMVMNQLGIHCACYGNHEFDFGLERLEDVNAATNFPWLLSNMVDDETQKPLGEAKEYHIVEWKGWKIGLMGLGEAQWLETMATINPEEVTYYDYVDKANQLCPILREQGCDYIIALTHLRRPNDVRLMENATDVDLFLGGHDHDYEIIKVNDKVTLKSGCDFAEFSILTLTTQEDSKVNVDIERIEVDSKFEPDTDMVEALSHYEEMLNANMEVNLGNASVAMDGREKSVRTMETNIGNFITDVMMASTNSDMALLNSGTIRGDRIHKKGDFKVKDLMTILPMADPLAVIEVTGQQLVEALENSVSKYEEESGRFLQVAGVQFVFNPDAAVGSRVPSDLVMVADKYVNLEDKYRLVTKDYLRKGKDGFIMFPDCKILVDEEECPQLTCCVQNHFEAIKTCQGKSKKKTAHRQNLVLVSRRHTMLQTDNTTAEPERKKSAKQHWRTLRILRQTLSVIKINKEHVDELEQQACKLAPMVEGRIEKVTDEMIGKLRIQKKLSESAVVEEKEKVKESHDLPDHFFPTVADRLHTLDTMLVEGADKVENREPGSH